MQKKAVVACGAILSVGMFLVAGCGTSTSPTSSSNQTTPAASSAPKSATVVLNWFPEPEDGGMYAGVQQGDYTQHGMNLTIESGGPSVSAVQIVAAGRAQFGVADADILLQARAQGIPVVAIFATFQTNPQVILYHPGQHITSFADLNGRPAYIAPGQAYWQYIVTKYHLNNVKLLTYNGSAAGFAANPKAVQQGYVTEDPYYLPKQGIPVKYLLTANSGYDPYNNVLFTTEAMIEKHPNEVKAFVQATQAGWTYYLQHPTQANKKIGSIATGLTTAGMAYSAKTEQSLIDGGDAASQGIGMMTADRWNKLAQQMESMKLLPSGFDVQAAYTTQFFPQ